MEEESYLLYEDVVWCLTRMPQGLVKMMKEAKDRLVLSGGFIRACIANEKISDIDLFVKSKDDGEMYARRWADNTSRFKGRVLSTCNAFTVLGRGKPVLQIIHRWTYEKPELILPSFDFTIARAAIWYDGDKWRGICDPRFYQDLAAKRLTYCSPIRIEEAGGSLLRVLKFYQRGYRIPLHDLAAVVARITSAVDFDKMDPENECRDMSEEERWAFVMSGLLREVDPQTDPTEAAYFPMPDDKQLSEMGKVETDG